MQTLSTEMPTSWLRGSRREWVTSVVSEPSESGVREPVAQQVRPFLRFTIDLNPNNVADIENLFIEANGPEKAWLCKPPLMRDHQMTAVPIGTGTGSPQSLQLMILRGQSWAALDPIADTITIYGNGSPLVGWTLGDDGIVSGTATLGHAVTATFQFKTRFAFLEQSLTTMLDAANWQGAQQVSFEEIV